MRSEGYPPQCRAQVFRIWFPWLTIAWRLAGLQFRVGRFVKVWSPFHVGQSPTGCVCFNRRGASFVAGHNCGKTIQIRSMSCAWSIRTTSKSTVVQVRKSEPATQIQTVSLTRHPFRSRADSAGPECVQGGPSRSNARQSDTNRRFNVRKSAGAGHQSKNHHRGEVVIGESSLGDELWVGERVLLGSTVPGC